MMISSNSGEVISKTGSSVTAPFIPYWIGTNRAPTEYRQHRYLTKDASRTFLSPDYQAQEATEFAGRVFKRLMYHTCERPERFLPEVVEALEAFEANILAELPRLEGKADALRAAGQPELSRDVLTRYSGTQAMAGLDLGRALLGSIEARTKVLFGIREPTTESINEPAVAGRDTISCVTSVDADEPVIDPDERAARPASIEAQPLPAPTEPSGERGWLGLGLAFALGLVPGGALVWLARRSAGS